MADLSGICSTHGLIVFNHDDGAGCDDVVEGGYQGPTLAPGWYWASCQHFVLTGKPNGPHPNRATALANAAMIIAAYDGHEVLEGSDLGK